MFIIFKGKTPVIGFLMSDLTSRMSLLTIGWLSATCHLRYIYIYTYNIYIYKYTYSYNTQTTPAKVEKKRKWER